MNNSNMFAGQYRNSEITFRSGRQSFIRRDDESFKPEGALIGSTSNRDNTQSLLSMELAMANRTNVEGMAVMCDRNLDITVEFRGSKGYTAVIPHEEAVYTRNNEPVKDIAIITRVGKPVVCKVMSIEYPTEEGALPKVILSRRLAQLDFYENCLPCLVPGDIIQSRVTHLEPFGAFVDIGCGVVSLLSVDCISVSRIDHPSSRFFPGMWLYTVIKTVDTDSGRVFLSHKELLGTWEENASMFSVGQTVRGVIRSIEDYGVFVELTPNLAGLAERKPESELDRSVIGKTCAVYIKSIIPEKMKIKLVAVDSFRTKNEHLPPFKYFIDGKKVSHIDSWRYSPEQAKKLVETNFSF